MLMGEDFDLNSTQRYADSLKEVFKHTMLNQEVIFRKQVHELHRLYRIQKTLMEDFAWKGFDGYNLQKASTQSTLETLANPIRYEPLAKERTFFTIPMVGSTRSINKDYIEKHKGIYPRLQPKPLDLQLPMDHYINDIGEDLLKKANGWESPKESVEVEHYFHGDDVSPPKEVKLSLSIGGDTREKRVGERTWCDKSTKFSFQHVIDLEESSEKVSNDNAEPVSALGCDAPITYSGEKHDSKVSVQSNQSFTNGVKKDPCHGLTVNHSFVDGSENCQEQNSLNQGFQERNDEIPCNIMFTKVKPSTFYKTVDLDLNKVQPDGSSFYLSDPMVAYASTTSSSGVFNGLIDKIHEGTCPTTTSWGKPDIILSSETSVSLRQDDDVDSFMMDSSSNNNSTNIWARSAPSKAIGGREVSLIDLESLPEPPPDLHEDLARYSGNSKNENVPSQLNPNGDHTDVAMVDINGEKGEGNVMFLHPDRSQNTDPDGHSNRSPASSCKLDCTNADNSSTLMTMQSGNVLGESNLSPVNKFPNSQSSQVAETPSCEPDLRSSDSSELKHQCNKKKEESVEVDILIQNAAESLIYISLESPSGNQDCFTKAEPNEIENKERKQPQYTSDSYESIVLKLTERSVDDYCVSSKPFEVDEMDKRDCGIKLKRGRRLKDFQRDILPGLASLSRHEICEDINIMEAVIRSREYKKMKSRMAGGENWFAPVRSRRSRFNYISRRYIHESSL
ncbi:hypothetical protein F0562_012000 [Nyssa sinensis]|uniref:Uncharacterized protein n=1 Tax=Nyssa sinensis TaxID=561372 RepID=A0A5J4ZW33_9ASTE|nr:hypothetical protein F0562_012000 [Nyssa sinensis]